MKNHMLQINFIVCRYNIPYFLLYFSGYLRHPRTTWPEAPRIQFASYKTKIIIIQSHLTMINKQVSRYLTGFQITMDHEESYDTNHKSHHCIRGKQSPWHDQTICIFSVVYHCTTCNILGLHLFEVSLVLPQL